MFKFSYLINVFLWLVCLNQNPAKVLTLHLVDLFPKSLPLWTFLLFPLFSYHLLKKHGYLSCRIFCIISPDLWVRKSCFSFPESLGRDSRAVVDWDIPTGTSGPWEAKRDNRQPGCPGVLRGGLLLCSDPFIFYIHLIITRMRHRRAFWILK